MKIVLINDRFPPEITGIGNYIMSLAKRMENLGHKLYIISGTKEKEKEGENMFENLAINRIYSPPSHYLRNYYEIYNPHTVKKIGLLLKKIKPDVTQFFNVHESISYYPLKLSSRISLVTAWFARDVMSFSYNKLTKFIYKNNFLEIPKNINYQLTFLDRLKQAKKSFNPAKFFLIKHYLSYPDLLFSVSESLKEAMRQNNINYDIKVLHSGIDVDEYYVNKKEIDKFKRKFGLSDQKILFIGGRLSFEKGSDQTIQALKIILAEYPKVVLFMAAKKNDYTTKIIERARINGIKRDNIILSDWLDRQEIKISLAASDIVLTPSLCLDAFPKINLEAMALGKPVIGTCFGGTPEVVQDGVTGFIITPLNVKLMAKKILILLQNKEKSLRFGQAGKERVKNFFNLSDKAKELLDIYQSVLIKKNEKNNRYNKLG